jgi:hypothetical protein
MSILANDIWSVFRPYGAGATSSITDGILEISDASTDTNGARYVAVSAKGGDKIRFEVMARSVSGQGRIYLNLESLPGVLVSEAMISGSSEFRTCSIEYVIPYIYATVDVYIGIGCTYPDIGVIQAFAPAIYLNDTVLFGDYGVHWAPSGGQLRMNGKSILDVKLYGGEKCIAIASPDIAGDIFLPFGTVDARLRMIGNYNYNSCFGLMNLNPSGSEGTTVRQIKSRSSVAGAYSATQTGDPLGASDFWGDNGLAFGRAARIDVVQDAAVSGSLVPGKIQFKVTTPSASDQITLVLDSARSVRPGADNAQLLGTPSSRWSGGNFGTAPTVTSDERSKKEIRRIDDACLDAWAEVEFVQYKFDNAIELKGDLARWHFGVIAQRVRDAFERHGIDAHDYGLLCYDEWAEQPEIVESWDDEFDEVGSLRRAAGTEVIQEFRPAGDRFGIRYDYAFAIEAALQRRTTKMLLAKFDALAS